MNREQKKIKRVHIKWQQKRQEPSISQIVSDSIQWRLNYIDEIVAELKQTKQELILNALVSVLLFILLLRYEFLWIPFFISCAYSIVPLTMRRWHKRNLAHFNKELEKQSEFLKRVNAVS